MGNNLPDVSGLIETRDPIAVSGTIVVEVRQADLKMMGRRYPRARLQAIAVAKR